MTPEQILSGIRTHPAFAGLGFFVLTSVSAFFPLGARSLPIDLVKGREYTFVIRSSVLVLMCTPTMGDLSRQR
jgi:hypothetical protein